MLLKDLNLRTKTIKTNSRKQGEIMPLNLESFLVPEQEK